MRCSCCNRNLSNYESTLRHPITNDFLDICKKCLVDIPISPVQGTTVVDDPVPDEDDWEQLDFEEEDDHEED
jgi:hypothetical protein